MAKAHRIHAAAAASLIILAGAAWPLASQAQSLTRSEQTSGKVTVEGWDAATRHLTVKAASGEVHSLKVPESLHNTGNLKPGDVITVTYARETEIVLSKPNKPLPKDTDAALSARAAKGQLPAGLIANHIVVTGSVLGIDQANHRLKIASPKGGEVHTVSVTTPEGREAMKALKVGDKLTAYVTEALLLSTSRN